MSPEDFLIILLAALGSFLIWKFYGKKLIIKYGAELFWKKIEDMVEHPDSKESQKIGKLTGLCFAYLLDGISEMIETQEGRDRLKPIMGTMFQSIQGMIFGTWGQILEKMRAEGEGLGGGPNGPLPMLPPSVLGAAAKVFPGINIQDALGVIQFLSNFKGRSDGSAQGFSSPRPGGSAGSVESWVQKG